MHMGKRIVAIMLSILFCIVETASAEMKDFHGTGEYTMSKYETPAVAEERAVQEAERDALEQAGVYVESYTKTENMQVKKDTITVLTNGILKITKRDITTTTTPTGEIRVKAEITASIDTEDINKNLKDTAAMEKLQEKYDALQKEYQKQSETLEQLKKDNAKNMPRWAQKKVEKEKLVREKDEEIIAAFLTRDESKDDVLNRPLFSNLHVLKADSLQAQGKYQEAIEWYTKSIELNPKNPNYYFARAWTEGISNDYVSAISDYKMYLKYDPEDQEGRTEAAYTDISFAYAVLTQYEKSIEYADKALALNPNNKDAQLWKKKSLEALGRW